MSSEKTEINISALPISYETGDALAKPMATSIGEAGKTLLDGLFHLVLDPIRRFNIQRENDLERFKSEVNQTVEQIPSEYYDDSKIGLVLKTIEDSRYQLNEEELREMFSKLIASTLDSRTNSSITPKYSTIISQMSIAEARLLKEIYNNRGSVVPSANIKIVGKNYETRELNQDTLLLDSGPNSNCTLELSLLESSNIIEFHHGSELTHPHFQEKITTYVTSFPPNLDEIFSGLSDSEHAQFIHSYYSLTELGRSLCNIVFK